MENLYNWLKERKKQGNGDRKVTLVYSNSIFEHKKACIKPRPYGYSGHYIATIPDEKKPDYYEINYLLCFIEEDFLRNYYVTCEGMVKDPYDDRLAYKLKVTNSREARKNMLDVRIKDSNSHYGIHPLPIDPISADDCFSLKKELSRIALDGVWDSKKRLEIKKLILDGPATIILWKDGTKTVVKCDKDDIPDPEKGILYAVIKKLCNKKEYNDILRAIDAWVVCNNIWTDLFPDNVEVEKSEKPKKKVYKRKFGDSDQNCPNCGQNWIWWSNNRRLSFLRDGFINITCRNCGHKFRYVKGGRYESQ